MWLIISSSRLTFKGHIFLERPGKIRFNRICRNSSLHKKWKKNRPKSIFAKLACDKRRIIFFVHFFPLNQKSILMLEFSFARILTCPFSLIFLFSVKILSGPQKKSFCGSYFTSSSKEICWKNYSTLYRIKAEATVKGNSHFGLRMDYCKLTWHELLLLRWKCFMCLLFLCTITNVTST